MTRALDIQLSKNFNFLEVVNGTDLPQRGRDMNITYLNNISENEFKRILRENYLLAYYVQTARDYFSRGHRIWIELICGGRTREWDISRGRSGEGGHPQWIAWDIVIRGVDDTTRNDMMRELYYNLLKSWMGGLGLRINGNDITMIHIDTRLPREKDIQRGFGRRWTY